MASLKTRHFLTGHLPNKEILHNFKSFVPSLPSCKEETTKALLKPQNSVELHRAGVTRASSSLFAEDAESCFAQMWSASRAKTHTSARQSCLHGLGQGEKPRTGTCPEGMLCQPHCRRTGKSAFPRPRPTLPTGPAAPRAELGGAESAAGGDARRPQHRVCKRPVQGLSPSPLLCGTRGCGAGKQGAPVGNQPSGGWQDSARHRGGRE